ncbi:MAG: pectinacetylesterase family protein [Anaerolineae bacterium]|nr:pectinacetylesterase family protein [Anaerolineae bacterium]
MTKRKLKLAASIIGLLILIALIAVVVLYSILIRTTKISSSSDLANLPLNTWGRIDLSDKTVCSDGSDYRIYVRRGETDNLLIHFSGGGAAWDAETASHPIEVNNISGYYFAYIWEILRAVLGGIFQQDNPKNPFHNWNEVYIPYCTADFHIGAATVNYSLANGETQTIHHNGQQNVTEALDWVYTTFNNPGKLVISGESAGAFGSTFWTPSIAEHYAQSHIYHIGDGSYLESPRWNEIIETVWQADPENNLDFEVGDDLIGSAYLHYNQSSPANVTYLHINTVYDEVLIWFSAKLNEVTDYSNHAEIWSQGLRDSIRQVDTSDLNYYYYITDYGLNPEKPSTPHTSIGAPLFYEMEQDGVKLFEWVQKIVLENEHFSVGSQFLQ